MRTTPAETERNNQIILDSAIRIFTEKGYEATGMQDIAETAKISRGPLYYRYKNKAEIYLAALKEYCAREITVYQQIFAGDNSIFEKVRKDLWYCSRGIGSDTSGIFPYNLEVPGAVDIFQEAQADVFRIKKNAVLKAIQNQELSSDTEADSVVALMFLFVAGLQMLKNHRSTLVAHENVHAMIEESIAMLQARYGK